VRNHDCLFTKQKFQDFRIKFAEGKVPCDFNKMSTVCEKESAGVKSKLKHRTLVNFDINCKDLIEYYTLETLLCVQNIFRLKVHIIKFCKKK
jgi:hypothetical protein